MDAAPHRRTGTFLRSRRRFVIVCLPKGISVVFTGGTVLLHILPMRSKHVKPGTAILRSQIVTSRSWGGRRYPPLAFTEQGVAMLSSVLNSDHAIREMMMPPVKAKRRIGFHAD